MQEGGRQFVKYSPEEIYTDDSQTSFGRADLTDQDTIKETFGELIRIS